MVPKLRGWRPCTTPPSANRLAWHGRRSAPQGSVEPCAPGPRSRPPRVWRPVGEAARVDDCGTSEHLSREPLFPPSRFLPRGCTRRVCVTCPLHPPGPGLEKRPWATRRGKDLVARGRRRLSKRTVCFEFPGSWHGCVWARRTPSPKPRTQTPWHQIYRLGEPKAREEVPMAAALPPPVGRKPPESWALAAVSPPAAQAAAAALQTTEHTERERELLRRVNGKLPL